MRKHNHIAILVSLFIPAFLSGLWYSPLLFGNAWFAGHGIASDTMGSLYLRNPIPFTLDIIGDTILLYFISWMVIRLNLTKASQGLGIGLIVSFGILFKAVIARYGFLEIKGSVMLIDLTMDIIWIIVPFMILPIWRRKQV